jgi:hypothetical protein
LIERGERVLRVTTKLMADSRSNGRGGFRTCDLSRVKRALSH